MTVTSDETSLSAKARDITKLQRGRERELQNQRHENNDCVNLEQRGIVAEEYLGEYQEHLKSGSPWKFKKPRQGWIIKHLYDYRWKNEELLQNYLKTVQGKARDRLIMQAKEIITTEEEKEVKDEVILSRAQTMLNNIVE